MYDSGCDDGNCENHENILVVSVRLLYLKNSQLKFTIGANSDNKIFQNFYCRVSFDDQFNRKSSIVRALKINNAAFYA